MKCVNGCGLCTYKFSRSTSLYRHLRNHALKKDLMPYLCSICQVGYIDTYSLYLHATNEHNAASVTEMKKVMILVYLLWLHFLFKNVFFTV